MSVHAISTVFQKSKATAGSRLVLLALADRADDEGYCFPSINELVAKTLLSRRGVTLAIATLERSGELRRARGLHVPANARERKLSSNQATTEYEIILPGLAAREHTSLAQQPKLGNLGSLAPRPAREISDIQLGKSAQRSKGTVRHTDPSQGKVAAPEWLSQLWNEHIAGKIKPVQDLTKTRRRLAEGAWRQHPEATWWRTALTRAYQSRFLLGAKGWAMDFDWFLKADNAVRILEGVHDNRQGDYAPAYEKAQTIIQRGGGSCSHTPTCADREEHLERIVDRLLGLSE